MYFSCHLVDEQGNRNAPRPLTGDTPVRPISQHTVDAGTTPIRYPLHAFHRRLCGREQPIPHHADKPLRRCTKNNGGLVAPAMRVAVLERLVTQQALTIR